MLKFCDKNKGAISVFLTLILLPVLLLGGLTTDAARIFASKVVISDAGEMAMNAALAQYDTDLLDEYGLFAMSKDPESMKESLEKYFNASLNGTGLPDAEEYQKILDLVTEEFKVINVEASKLYQTEVEKQQIIEYMKYRAPVCLAEELLEKLDVLKSTKQVTEAVDAQLDFAEAMEDCQDMMEEAKTAMDDLSSLLAAYPTQEEMQRVFDETAMIYQGELSKALLMQAAAIQYQESADLDGESAAESFVEAAEGIDLGNPLDQGSFEDYLNAKYYMESAGKITEIVAAKKAEEPDDDSSEEYEAWEAEYEELKALENDYEDACGIVSAYPGSLEDYARKQCIAPQTALISGYYEQTDKGSTLVTEALEKLQSVKESLEAAQASWQKWSDKTEAISDSDGLQDVKSGMQNNVKESGELFSSGDNEKNLSNIDKLLEKVKTDEQYFLDMHDILLQVKFFDQALATTSEGDQYSVYHAKAMEVTSGVTSYANILDLMSAYQEHYETVQISTSCILERITKENDLFYQQLVEYCESKSSEESSKEKKEANSRLETGMEASKNAGQEEKAYPKYQWILDDKMPSVLLKKEAEATKKNTNTASVDGDVNESEDAENMASVDGDVNNSKGRKAALAAAKSSIKNAKNFLTKLDNLLTEGISNLYVAEYAMQMFSYYTVDKQVDGSGKIKTLSEDEVVSMSGYKLSKRTAYKAEVEYILWGNASSKTNVCNTVKTIFGIRLLLNSIFAFSNTTLCDVANKSATLIAGVAPYLIPVVQAIIQFGFACLETSDDIARIKEGYGVAVLKSKETWKTFPTNGFDYGDNTKGSMTLDYSEFLRIFLNVNMLGDLETRKLARIADCIQLNTESDLTNAYTMLALHAKIRARTTFMKKISDMGSGAWKSDGNTYSIDYQSILGY